MYFFVVETTYYGARPTTDKLAVSEKHKSVSSVFELEEEREPYRSQLALFRGRLSQESFWKNAWKPVPLIAFPAVLFSTIVYGSYFVSEPQELCARHPLIFSSFLDLAPHHLRPLRQHLLRATVLAESSTSRSYQPTSPRCRTYRLAPVRLDSRCSREVHGPPQQGCLRAGIPPDSDGTCRHLRHNWLPRLWYEHFCWLPHRLALGIHVHSLALRAVRVDSQSDLRH